MSLERDVLALKREMDAVIVAHNYQLGEVQDIADYVGDSFALSYLCSQLEAKVILFCGVFFMAESADLLAVDKEVLIPVRETPCYLADSITAPALREMKEEYPTLPVVTYVNTTAEVKAESTICCTSSNALKVVEAVEGDRVLFVPDKNLASYVAQRTEKTIIPWNGACTPHERLKLEDIERVESQFPHAFICLHPESPPLLHDRVHFVGGTDAILDWVKRSKAHHFFIGTEIGLIHRLKKENPHKSFSILSPDLICPAMKVTTLEDVYLALKERRHVVSVEEGVRRRAVLSLKRMLEVR